MRLPYAEFECSERLRSGRTTAALRAAARSGLFLLPLAANSALWIAFVLVRGPRYGLYGLGTGVWAAVAAGCGPLLYIFSNAFVQGRVGVYVTCATVWLVFLLLIHVSHIDRGPWVLRLIVLVVPSLWCLLGSFLLSVAV